MRSLWDTFSFSLQTSTTSGARFSVRPHNLTRLSTLPLRSSCMLSLRTRQQLQSGTFQRQESLASRLIQRCQLPTASNELQQSLRIMPLLINPRHPYRGRTMLTQYSPVKTLKHSSSGFTFRLEPVRFSRPIHQQAFTRKRGSTDGPCMPFWSRPKRSS